MIIKMKTAVLCLGLAWLLAIGVAPIQSFYINKDSEPPVTVAPFEYDDLDEDA